MPSDDDVAKSLFFFHFGLDLAVLFTTPVLLANPLQNKQKSPSVNYEFLPNEGFFVRSHIQC